MNQCMYLYTDSQRTENGLPWFDNCKEFILK